MQNLSGALGILSAIITPAVLILATGSLLMTTSTRLARSIDRARELAAQIESIALGTCQLANPDERKLIIFDQIKIAAQRARILQRAMTVLYVSLGLFISTSVTIGIFEVTNLSLIWFSILLGVTGTGLLFYASLVLITESSIALKSVNAEMNDVIRLSIEHIPEKERKY